jgi:transketolase
MEENNSGRPLELREVFGKTLVALGNQYPEMVVLDADLNTSSKVVYFKKAFPDRFIQVGIAEQNLFGVAAGLAVTGFTPFPSTFASFASRRALDQIAISICYPGLNVKIPGSYVGLPTSRAGASHNCIEDIAVMRVLPNMRVADPGDNADMRAILQTAMQTEGPVYFRVARLTLDNIFPVGHEFKWGKGVLLREGRDVTLFGTGMMTSLCLRAADLLLQEGVKAEVIHLASIKPIDQDLILESTARTGCAVTAENASIIGGFGSAVAEAMLESRPVPLFRIGVRDRFVECGGIDELFTYHRMQPEHIAEAARDSMRAKEKMRSYGNPV